MTKKKDKSDEQFFMLAVNIALIGGAFYAIYWLVSFMPAWFLSQTFESESVHSAHAYLMRRLVPKLSVIKQLFFAKQYWVLASPLIAYFVSIFLQYGVIKKARYWIGITAVMVLALVGYDTFVVLNGMKNSSEFVTTQFLFSLAISIGVLRAIDPEKYLEFFHTGIKKNKDSDTYGTSAFMGANDVKKILSTQNTGLILDGVDKKLTEKTSFQNVLVCAATGVGKTQTYILPNLMQHREASIVVTDPSGELYQKTGTYFEELGYEIIVLEPYRKTHSDTFNPLLSIKSISDAKRIAKTLTLQVQSASDPFWHTASSALIAALLLLSKDLATHYNDDNFLTFRKLKELIVLDKESLETMISEPFVDEKTRLEVNASYQGSAELISSIKSLALSAMELFSDEHFESITQTNSVNFLSLRQKKTVLFIVVPEHKIQFSKAFVTLVYTQLFESLLSESEGYPVYVYLEEFANIGVIPDFSTIITTSRKRRISISLVIQDIEQIETRYKGQLETIISGGCLTKLFYAGLGNKTAKYVAELCGKETKQSHSVTKRDLVDEQSMTEGEVSRYLLNPDEIRRINSNEAIIVSGNLKPIKLTITPAYKQKKLMKIMAETNTAETAKKSTPITTPSPKKESPFVLDGPARRL